MPVNVGAKIRLVAAVTGVAVMLLVGVAAAHSTSARLFDQGVWVAHGGVTASHHFVYACDDRTNGRGVYTKYYYSGGYGQVNETRGNGHCTQIQVGPAITQYKVCEMDPGIDVCTPLTKPNLSAKDRRPALAGVIVKCCG